MLTTHLDALRVSRPDATLLATEAHTLAATLATSAGREAVDAVARWDTRRRTLETSRCLAAIRFAQDTRDEGRRADKEFWDDLGPTLQQMDTDVARAALSSPGRTAIGTRFGAHSLALWDCATQAFDPAIADDRREESRLVNRYDALRASLKVSFRGQDYTLASIRGFFGDADRAVRRESMVAEAQAMAGVQDELDGLYQELVAVRHRMARTLGLSDFVPLGYRWMKRTDWGPEQAAAFRQGVLEHVVPVAAALRQRRARALGVDAPTFHDEPVRDLLGVPRPIGDASRVVETMASVMERLGPGPRRFFDSMRSRGMLDLLARPGKVGGGFAESLPDAGTPFILANFVGNQDDVLVLVHELGHGYQMDRSLSLPLLDYLIPTSEAAEVHSMGLELLAHPHMEALFGADADRFRQGHLESTLLFLPYGCAIDEFQHRVYQDPGLGPQGRADVWRELEARWLPWRRYEGMPHYEGGRVWQRQLHVYVAPFYYLDYALAQVGALQLWDRSRTDPRGALATWEKLCDLGGSLSFTDLLTRAGLGSPFDDGVLARAAGSVARAVGV